MKYSLLLITGFALLASPAFADPYHNEGQNQGRSYAHGKMDDRDNGNRPDHEQYQRQVVQDRYFNSSNDRNFVHEYYQQDYSHRCPPGLAKKHNGCRAPGQAKRYRVGYVLPKTVKWQPVPHDIFVRLRPAPANTQYVVVDRDVLLVSEATKQVLDAVVLFSAVGN
jgi:hypothetical protein